MISRTDCESSIRTLVNHAWDHEVRWSEILAWIENFNGSFLTRDEEQVHALFALSRFMYFGKRLVREMLRSLYRDHFEAPLLQRIRRNLGGTTDTTIIRQIYSQELASTRFVGIGTPAESGTHLLYYFRQVNRLPKDLFVDMRSAFSPVVDPVSRAIKFRPSNTAISRYVFFDDLLGSGDQAAAYLSAYLRHLRSFGGRIDLGFMSVFATSEGLGKMNAAALFNGKAQCLFELDDSFKAFGNSCRYFTHAPTWFGKGKLLTIAKGYGSKLRPPFPLGYRDGQLLLGFSHNTPDNTLPIFWDEGGTVPWSPVFVRYDKMY